MDLKGAVVVITGSTRGFGKALASMLLAKGARVVISGRQQEIVDRVVAQLSSLGEVCGLACDVSIADQVYSLGEYALKQYGRIDIWVNNAGVTPPPGGVLDFPPEEAERTFRVNCMGTLHGTQTAVAIMKRQGFGKIVNLYGRGSDLRPATPSGLYGATKAWITSFTRTMAAEYKHLPIQFIGFSPGMMTTEMLSVDEIVGETVVEPMRAFPTVLKALGNPPDVPAAELVRLLEKNNEPFTEYYFMRGLRLIKMLMKLIWMNLSKQAQPPEQKFHQRPSFEPPITDL